MNQSLMAFGLGCGLIAAGLIAGEPRGASDGGGRVAWNPGVSGGRSDDAPAMVREIEYAVADGESLRLDIGIPRGEGPFPAIVLVHGGGWTGGSKAGDTAGLLDPLIAAGFTTVAIDYRLAPLHRWPACIEDVLAAIRWTKERVQTYKGDPDRIALVGYSAGGHLACFAATVVDDSARVQAVVGLAALTDFEQELPKRGNVLGRAQRGLLNRPQELTPESLGLLRAISPVNHLRPGLPPFLLIHGDADPSVSYEQSVAFQSALQRHDVSCELITLPGAPHALRTWAEYDPSYLDRMIAWLHAALASRRN